MTVSPSLSEEALRRLRSVVSGTAADNGTGTAAARSPVGRAQLATRGSAAKRVAKRYIQRAISWYVDPAARAAADDAYRRVERDLLFTGGDQDPRVLAINQELIKAEVRSLLGILDDLGQAIAPAAGLAGARVRMAELRERLNDLDRRTRRLAAAPPEAPVERGTSRFGTETPPAAGASRFDYAGFERRFRGESDAITLLQSERYFDLLRDHGPVLDIGCGRGELVGALAEAGVVAFGVDLDADAVGEGAAMGRDLRQGDALALLRDAEPGSLGAIVSFHLVEHLELEPLLELLELAATRLRPGGVFVAETPNPATLIVLGNSYILDPTHVRPLHPSLMVFLCERAGFRDIDLRFYAPATGYQLALLEADDLPEWAQSLNTSLTKLNDVLFGPQEYAVVAHTPLT